MNHPSGAPIYLAEHPGACLHDAAANVNVVVQYKGAASAPPSLGQ